MTKLTFIIPVYNEIKTIEKLIKKILKLNIKKQIIIIDDGSNDGTEQILRKYKNLLDKLIIHKKNLGKGAAIKSGQKHIKGKYVAIQDADLEYDPNDLKKIINEMDKKNLKVMYGSRVLNKNTFQNIQNFTHILRIWGNIFLTIISNFFNSQKLTDAHTCYKVFNSRIFKKIKLKEKGFSFCPEITTKISLMNIDIEEFPINYNGRTYNQGKKITAFDGLDALYVLLKYRYFK